MGLHAVAATGFSLGVAPVENQAEAPFRLRAEQIDKLYVHDDKVGPFARMGVRDGGRPDLDSSWRRDGSPDLGHVVARVRTILVPVYAKIRIPFGNVHDAVADLDSWLRSTFRSMDVEGELDELIWNIRLTQVREWKAVMLNQDEPMGGRTKWLERPLPRFMWVADAARRDTELFTLLFDATDIQDGRWLVGFVRRDEKVCALLEGAVAQDEFFTAIEPHASASTLNIFRYIVSDGVANQCE